jgi:hypothetical protein
MLYKMPPGGFEVATATMDNIIRNGSDVAGTVNLADDGEEDEEKGGEEEEEEGSDG